MKTAKEQALVQIASLANEHGIPLTAAVADTEDVARSFVENLLYIETANRGGDTPAILNNTAASIIEKLAAPSKEVRNHLTALALAIVQDPAAAAEDLASTEGAELMTDYFNGKKLALEVSAIENPGTIDAAYRTGNSLGSATMQHKPALTSCNILPIIGFIHLRHDLAEATNDELWAQWSVQLVLIEKPKVAEPPF